MATARTGVLARLFVQSAIGTAQQVTAVTAGKPPVVTYVGADPANGDVIAFTDVFGMNQLNDGLCRVANVNAAANTLELKDQDTTGFSAFTAGNMQVVTLANELTAATSIAFTGGEQKYANYQLMNDDVERQFPVGQGGVNVEVEMLFDPFDAGCLVLRQASEQRTKRAFRLLYSDGVEMLFFGYVGFANLPAGNGSEVLKTKATISMASRPRYVKP